MECPHCAADNMPGLAVCLFCGKLVAEAPAAPSLPERLVPRVAPQNPLLGRSRPRTPGSSRAFRLPRWIPALFRGLALGLVPGLAALVRREWRIGLLQLGAILGSAGLVAALWFSEHQGPAWLLLHASFAWSPAREIVRALNLPGLLPRIGGALIGLAAVLAVSVTVETAVDRRWPRVVVGPDAGADFPPGVVFCAPYGDERPGLGDVVAVRLGEDREQVLIAPVVALPGSAIRAQGFSAVVDGRPSPVRPLQPAEFDQRQARIVERTLGPEEYALFVVPLHVAHRRQILGRLHYRWTPARARGLIPAGVNLGPASPPSAAD